MATTAELRRLFEAEERAAWDRYATAFALGNTADKAARGADLLLAERRKRFSLETYLRDEGLRLP